MSEPTTAAGRELLVTIQDEHCRLDDNGCHSADEHFVSEGVPAIESEAYAQGVREERKRIGAALVAVGLIDAGDFEDILARFD